MGCKNRPFDIARSKSEQNNLKTGDCFAFLDKRLAITKKDISFASVKNILENKNYS